MWFNFELDVESGLDTAMTCHDWTLLKIHQISFRRNVKVIQAGTTEKPNKIVPFVFVFEQWHDMATDVVEEAKEYHNFQGVPQPTRSTTNPQTSNF